jgi:hypothetical protein
MVDVKLPPPDRNINPRYFVIESGSVLRRIFDPTRHGATAIGFRHYGSISRFDHQRRIDGKAQVDKDRGIMYLGFTLSCCLVEVFGDDGIIDIEHQELATFTINQNLKLLDLRGQGAWDAGTVASITSDGRRDRTQAWGKYFYDNPVVYGLVDGLIFNNAHNSEEAIALYERAASQINKATVDVKSLKDKSLRRKIFLSAKKLNLGVQFS